MTTDNFCFYLQNRLIQTSQTGGQLYSDTSPFNIPCPDYQYVDSTICMDAAASLHIFSPSKKNNFCEISGSGNHREKTR
jgi:hypothetical protein